MANYLISLLEDSLAKLNDLKHIPTIEKMLGEHSITTSMGALREVMADTDSPEHKALPRICEAAEGIVALVDSFNPTPGLAINAFEIIQTALAIRVLYVQEQDPVAVAQLLERRKLRSILDAALEEHDKPLANTPLPKLPRGLRTGYTGQRKFPSALSDAPCDCCDGGEDPPQPDASHLHPN